MEKNAFYQSLVQQAEGLIAGERNVVANMANISALLFMSLEDINWAGFYLVDNDDELVLGPFQGNPACIRIPIGKGVCGTAAQLNETQRIDNYISCGWKVKSEIVIPIIKDNKVIAVLDIDSPIYNRFDAEDQAGLEQLIRTFEQQL